MGFVDHWRARANDKLDDDERIVKSTAAQIDQWKTGTIYQHRVEMGKKAQRYYDGKQGFREKGIEDDKTGAKKQETTIQPVANYFRLTVDRECEFMIAATSKVIPRTEETSVPSDAKIVESVEVEFDKVAEQMDWRGFKHEQTLKTALKGTSYVYVGHDPLEGEQEPLVINQPVEEMEGMPVESVEGEGTEQAKIQENKEMIDFVAAGGEFVELLDIECVSLDAEALKFVRSRCVVIERQKTLEDLFLQFPDEKKRIIEIKEEAKGLTGWIKQSWGAFTGKGTVQEGKLYLLREVLLDPEPKSECYPDGLHAWIVGKEVIAKDDASWKKGQKPIVAYIFKRDPRTPLGDSINWQLFAPQFYENLAIRIITLAGQSDVTNRLLVRRGAVQQADMKKLTNDPSVIVDLPEIGENAIRKLQGSSLSVPLMTMLREYSQIREDIGQVFSIKYGFRGDQKVGIVEALLERERNAFVEAIENQWGGDKKIWRVVFSHLYPELARSNKYNFVISNENLPEPKALMRRKIIENATIGVYGAPGSPQAMKGTREALKQIGELGPDDPRMHLAERIGEYLSAWVENIGKESPFLSIFWDHELVAYELDLWYAERFKELNEEQAMRYALVRSKLDELGMARMEERLRREQEMKARILALSAPAKTRPPSPGIVPQGGEIQETEGV